MVRDLNLNFKLDNSYLLHYLSACINSCFIFAAAGYVVVVDFGFAKVVLDKTFTTCGSPEYMGKSLRYIC